MKILQISPVAPPHHSGMANAAGELCKAIARASVEVIFVSPFGKSFVAGINSNEILKIKHFKFPGLGFLSFTPAILRLAKSVDAIHLHYPCYGNAMMVAFARTLGCKKPLIISYHMDTVGRGLRRPVFAFHAKFLAPRFLRRASAIVVASRDYAANSLLGKYSDLMAKVVEIPFGIDAERFSPRTPLTLPSPMLGGGTNENTLARARERVAARPGEGCNILFVGGLDEQHYFKGLHVLLEALVKIPNATLTVVGCGNLVKEYARRAYELKIDERVRFAGRASGVDLPDYYRAADVFCLPSLDRSEAYGIVLMEAAASGIPAVATDIPGVRSVVKNNETGLLVKPGDPLALAEALNSILNNSQLKTRLGTAACALALTRTWKSAGEKYLEVYRKAIG